MYILKQFIIFQIVRPNKWVSESTPFTSVWENLTKINEKKLNNFCSYIVIAIIFSDFFI